ncbi:MAG: hypothetical protein V4489_00565 [Chlamydiota bacterium]
MKKKLTIISLMSLLFSSSIFAASPTATQTVSMTINSTSTLTTSGNPAALSISINSAGVGTSTDATTTYTVASNSGAKGKLKISGQITSGGDMPTNTSLGLSLASASGTSLGLQTLNSTTLVDLVSNLPTLVSDTGAATYTFNVVNGWTVPAASLSRTVTLTLVSVS